MPPRTLTPAASPAVPGPDTPTEPSTPPRSVSDAPGSAAATAADVPGPAAADVSAAWSRLRLIKVPADWPPYDCETHGAACPAARSVATANSRAGDQATEIARANQPGRATDTASGDDAPWADVEARTDPAVRSGAAARADAAGRGIAVGRGADTNHDAAWAARFAQVIVEVLAGSRSPRQLVPWTTEPVRAQVDLIIQALSSDQRPRIRRVMTSWPAAGVVEMTVVVSSGPRSRALALRLEHLPARQPVPGRPGRPARWLCTEIEAG
jgi:Family of unknown function (DUF6459)